MKKIKFSKKKMMTKVMMKILELKSLMIKKNILKLLKNLTFFFCIVKVNELYILYSNNV